MSSPSRDEDRPVSEVDAQALLARAAELDAQSPHALTMAQLREVALEAGLAEAAVDRAFKEWTARTVAPAAMGPVSGEPRPGIAARWRAAAVAPFTRGLWRNLLAFAGGWTLLALIAGTGDALGVDWLMRKALDPAGLALAAVLAYRLRARAAVVVSVGFTLSQAVEFLLDLLHGAPAVHGRDPHLLLMAVGVLLASVVTQGGRRPPTFAHHAEDEPMSDATPPRPPLARQRAPGDWTGTGSTRVPRLGLIPESARG